MCTRDCGYKSHDSHHTDPAPSMLLYCCLDASTLPYLTVDRTHHVSYYFSFCRFFSYLLPLKGTTLLFELFNLCLVNLLPLAVVESLFELFNSWVAIMFIGWTCKDHCFVLLGWGNCDRMACRYCSGCIDAQSGGSGGDLTL